MPTTRHSESRLQVISAANRYWPTAAAKWPHATDSYRFTAVLPKSRAWIVRRTVVCSVHALSRRLELSAADLYYMQKCLRRVPQTTNKPE